MSAGFTYETATLTKITRFGLTSFFLETPQLFFIDPYLLFANCIQFRTTSSRKTLISVAYALMSVIL